MPLNAAPEPIPGALDDVTADWLTTALRAAGELPRGTVEAMTVERIGDDRGFTGVIARIRPTYSDADQSPPESMVVKLPTADRVAGSSYRAKHNRDEAAVRRHYDRCAREVSFYRDLATQGGGAPHCYYAAADPEHRRVVLLLADLAGGRPGDALAGCSATEAAAIIEAIAPLHARMWRHPPGWLPRLITDPDASQRRYRANLDPFLKRHGQQLPPPVRETLRRLRTGYATVLATLARAPTTAVHGDLHLDNIIFNPGQPAAILDWQSLCRGPAAADLAEVVFGSLSVAERRASETDLLTRYTARLRDHGIDDYPPELLHRDCRLALLRQVAGRVGWLANADPVALSGRESALVQAAFGDGRLVAALLDHQLVHDHWAPR
jgi:aminoglycoside/choline kinase family phosphotransferase